MEFLDDEELKKLNTASLLKDEKTLLYLLKLFKLNIPQNYIQLIDSCDTNEIHYIEDLIHKRELVDITISKELNPICLKIRKKTEVFITAIDPEILKKFKIIIWETK